LGGGEDDIFLKYCGNFAESFGKILAKFHELKIATKPQHQKIQSLSLQPASATAITLTTI